MVEKNLSEKLKFLTVMEWRILGLIAGNKTSKEIAEALFISHRTVQNHRYNISQKLDLKGPNKLLEFAIQNRDFLLQSIPQKEVSDKDLKNHKSVSRGPKKKFIWVIRLAIIIILVSWISIFTYRYIFKSEQFAGDTEFIKISPDKDRIAVMPFRLISPDSTEAYISDGLTEELITQISQIPELRVIARTSVMPYKKHPKTLKEITNELNVTALLEGSVQREGDQIRISVQLIDTQSQENLWGQTFDRKFVDILTIQREIAWQVASALKVELFLEGLAAGEPESKVNEEAHTAYLKGRYFVNQNTGESFRRAINYYQQAIDIDSTYARAWAGLADVYSWLSNYGFMAPEKAYTESRRAAQKAIQLAPDMGEAHTALAAIALLYDWDFKAAESEFQTAIRLNPSDVMAHRLYALLQLARGNHQKALEHSSITVKLDPLSQVSNALHGRTYYFAKRYKEAIGQYVATLEINSEFWLVHSYLGEVYLELKQFEAAASALQKARQLAPENNAALARLGYGYAVIGETDEANQIIQKLVEQSHDGKILSFQITLIYAALGRKDEAFNWMQKAFDNRHDFMLDLPADPKLDPLRSDPRFQSFLEKMNFNS